MHALTAALQAAIAGTSPIEAAAAVTGLIYLLLAIARDARCWIAAFVSTALYLYVFARAHLYMQATLQVYYLLMAAYGWRQWRGGQGRPAVPVSRWAAPWHLLALIAVLAVSAVNARWLTGGAAAEPLLDAFTTWASVFACYLVTRKILENWAWWLGIDLFIAALCWRRQLYASAALYTLYLLLVVIGWRAWWLDWRARPRAEASA